MKKYTFLLLAFFLILTIGLSANATSVGSSVIAAPNSLTSSNSSREISAATPTKSNKDMSARSANELDSIGSSTTNNKNKVSDETTISNKNETKVIQKASNSTSCKTYDGNIFDKGDPGYKDCLRTIQIDRQGVNNIP